MKIIECAQGSPEWIKARLGRPTASCFDQIIQPKKLGPSTSQEPYLGKLVAEWFLGEPVEDYVSPLMERGSHMEKAAVGFYEFERSVDTRAVGLCLRDDEKAGASPDCLVGGVGGLEIKCPGAARHMLYHLDPEKMVEEYRCQLQGEAWVCELDWVDLLSFHPTIPSVLVRVQRDEKFISALAGLVGDFVVRLDAAKARLQPLKDQHDKAKRVEAPPREVVREPDPFAVNDDGDALLPIRPVPLAEDLGFIDEAEKAVGGGR